MPPRRGIVKSGNAGNSSKASKNEDMAGTKTDNEKPLFPPGSKYPLSLLHERCQKEGWDKPVVDTIRRSEMGYSFVVTLYRTNKKTSERENVRLSPHEPYLRPSSLEARHWGATYALYRFCNGIQLNRVLPAGPREYWNELAAEHKAAPDHLAWMYTPDPFAAQQEVKERQEKAAQKRQVAAGSSPSGTTSSLGPYKDSPEVRMAASLREAVEEAIKEGFSQHGASAMVSLETEAVAQVSTQLAKLGFKENHIKKALSFLSEPSPLLGNFLESASPLEAATEYLILTVPECDLPTRFLPSTNSSNPFISSVHAGTSDVKKRWIEEKAIKEAGFPIQLVKDLTADPAIAKDWPLLLAKLGGRLIDTLQAAGESDTRPFIIDEDELQSLGGERQDEGHYTLPSFTGPITLHIFFDATKRYPRPYYCPMFIASDKVPPYVRLHILSRILSALNLSPSSQELEHGFGMTLMRLLDEEWALIEDEGPPEIYEVMAHMMPKTKKDDSIPVPTPLERPQKGTPKISHSAQRSSTLRPQAKSVSATITEARRRLPAFKARAEFLKMLSTNRVVIVVGETGSGKTTQLPQYILESFEEYTEQGLNPYIVVTQPRRISAISVSDRVSEERGQDRTVGYAVRGKSKQSKFTQLLFCTTGIVLRRLGNGDQLRDVSHVIVDEVHERSLDGDFLLLALKQLLHTHPQLKIVLMSATINHEVFSRYFENAPVLTIPGITHPVTDRYLEDIIPMIGYLPDSAQLLDDKRTKQMDNLRRHYDGLDDQALAAVHYITSSKSIDYQLIGSLVASIVEKHPRAGVLIFLPGSSEIRRCIDEMNACLVPGIADILPLHANLPIEEQNRVFKETTKWKIIAATNVAETSITIEDIVYVIDAGKVKETCYSPESDLTKLEETFVTRAAARQRRGRAGRMKPGVCYKLYTKHMEKMVMEEFPKPEILRVPLEQVCLSAKLMNEGADIRDVLRQIIDPPDSATIDRAWSNLQELGAIDTLDKLTPLGRHMAMLPLDVRLAKMLILGTIFRCLDPILTIAAILSSRPLFTSPENMRDEATRARIGFATGNSDLLTALEVFNRCQALVDQPKSLRSFCNKNFISFTTLQEIFTLRREFCAALEERGFISPQCNPSDALMNMNGEHLNLLKAIILGGLWPRVARVHLPKSAIKFDKIQAGTIQRDNTAKEFKILDLREGRVFIHPASTLFQCSNWKSPFLVYFHKYQSSKVFLRDATEVPVYALLLFGGPVSVDHIKGGVTVGTKGAFVKLKAWPRIGVLVNQLRQLLDLLLANCIEEGTIMSSTQSHPVIQAMLDLLTRDGMTE